MTLFFLAFAGMGTLFFWMGVREAWRSHVVRQWTPTACVIERSDVRHDAAAHRHVFEVRYSYTAGGVEPYQSSTFKPGYDGTDDATDAQRLAHRYPVGGKATCYVNPADPTQATLQLPGYGSLGMSLFALPFMAVGYGGLWFTWRPSRPRDTSTRAISSTAHAGKGQWAAIAFFALFAAAGLAFLVPFFILPLWRMQQARAWPAVPCTVLSSSVQTHDGDDGDTYSIDILFEYEYGGVSYRSNRYSFATGSSSGYRGKQDVVNQHPPGMRTTCYVNPADPFFAVLHRGWTNMLWFGLIPLVFVLVGFGGMAGTWKAIRKQRRRDPLSVTDTLAQHDDATAPSAGELTRAAVPADANWMPPLNHDRPAVFLARRSKSLGGAAFLAAFAALWNGMVWSLLVPEVLSGWRSGPSGFSVIGSAFFTLFALPFVLVGVGVIGGVFYMVLKAFNPLPRVTLDRAVVPLAGTLAVAWELLGRSERVRHLTVTLEGVERATYRRGTNTTTDERVFTRLPLADADADRGDPLHGKATVTLPADTMHSFKSANNEIRWHVRIHGKIHRWPDVSETFEFAVVPPEPPVSL